MPKISKKAKLDPVQKKMIKVVDAMKKALPKHETTCDFKHRNGRLCKADGTHKVGIFRSCGTHLAIMRSALAMAKAAIKASKSIAKTKKFTVYINESVYHEYTFEARDEDEAEGMARTAYYDEGVEPDDTQVTDVSIDVTPSE